MKLIVDSGSTKADWIAIDDNGKVMFTTQTLGLNPEILDKHEIIDRLNDRFDILQNKKNATHLFFYGAGCGTDRMKLFLSQVFKEYFPNAIVVVEEDTYAAVFATTPKGEKAIVSILGTGSNCSYFDGKILEQRVQSLGYIIMDDCSGNVFGKRLIRKYYFNKMPKELASVLEKEYDVDPDYIKNKLYKEPNPNAYLATFAKFLIQNKDHEFCKKIIFKEMKSFIKNYILQFENCREVPVHFVGSIAFYLKDELAEIFEKYELKLGTVLRRPIDGLIAYHVANNN
ncbi:N-acetylglucosamine kinase [Flavobacterium gilvum]|uniref:N-acetylglucosamine kinase n=1 Tax=Flavobacterium gilvum TaxID=1492737 RepID=A0AAC9I6Z2_9FLAO|nr:N-acetylglucosamine kinase [Flavobacterium gilvum]AOW10431.1 N-acetylglucosamine kinase [Flavobacterium gilvum]KFC59060.1 N-acetylglucosamine kinase-like protein [Flavobacterium gilvum]